MSVSSSNEVIAIMKRPDRGPRRRNDSGEGARRPDGRREGTALRPKAHKAGPATRKHQRGPVRRDARGGPKHCPMCGQVVGDLARHMRERHDDAASHPRD